MPDTNVIKLEIATKISLFQECRNAMWATSRAERQTVMPMANFTA
jgi:hypothetical protein